MSKFKVGDTARVRFDLESGKIYGRVFFVENMACLKGCLVTIEKADKDGKYRVKGSDYIFTDDMLENPFGKSLLQQGYIVECRDGGLGLVIGDRVLKEDGYRMLDDYTEDLKANDSRREKDIMKVYKTNRPNLLSQLMKKSRLTLIAERKEVRKMTVREICNELGYDVEIVKEE